MRKLLQEGVDYGKVAEKAVAIIKGKGYNVVMFTLDGMETSDPEEARRFYIKDPNFMVTIDEDAGLIRINKNSNVELNEIEAAMKQLKNLAREYMLKSELKVFGKEIAPKDFAYQAKKLRDSKMNGINEASFSRMHGHKKTSYQTLESTKLIVRHKKEVDEDVRGSRARQIKSIFIERAGERFRFPHNCLPCARAMARHIDEGGEMHDTVGQYIIEVSGNLKQLVEFVRYTRTNKLINEDSEDIVKVVRENIAAYKRELQKFQGVTSYPKMCEQIANREGSELEEETDDLRDMFTVRKFDEKIGEALPLIKRLVTEKNAWRSMIEEASVEPFQVTSTEDLIENDAIEFDSPVQKLGYKIRTLSERVTEESDLSKFVHKIGNKMIEGVELSKFEKSVMRNVLENIAVVEEEVAEEDGFVDKLEEAMTDFERKMKVLEYDMDWDDEEDDYVDPEEVKATYPKDAVEYMLKDYDLVADDFVLSDRDYEAWADMYAKNGIDNLDGDGYYEWMKDFAENYIEEQVNEEPGDWDHGYNYEGPQRDDWDEGHWDCKECGSPEIPGERDHCPVCGSSWEEQNGGITEDPNDWSDEEAEEELYKGFYGDDNEELGYDPEIQWMDPAGGIHYHDEDDPAAMYEGFMDKLAKKAGRGLGKLVGKGMRKLVDKAVVKHIDPVRRGDMPASQMAAKIGQDDGQMQLYANWLEFNKGHEDYELVQQIYQMAGGPLEEAGYKDGEALQKVNCPECGDFSMDLQSEEGDYLYYVCNTCGYDKEEYVPVTKNQWRDCEECGATGTDPVGGEDCWNCGGEGRFLEDLGEDFERDRPDRDYSSLAGKGDCPSCHGTGANTGRKMLTHGWNCPDCKGTGKVIEAIQDEECETCKDWDDDDKRVCPDCAI